MTDDIDTLAKHLKERQDRAVSINDLSNELGLPQARVARYVKDLMKRDGFFDLGNNRVMFSGSADLAAFEIFRTAAAHVSYEEFLQYRDQPHILMRLSRDREVAYRTDTEKLLRNAVKEKEDARGNSVF